ncbi:MAG: hypothetical protein K5945_03470 [Bacteroidaceae bacterium]|nr:hypothetical protein [Bacteroidaceae bacterium]
MKIIRTIRMGALLTVSLTMAHIVYAQPKPIIPDGYYTLSSMQQDASGLLYTYDTNALRDQYGNVIDYTHPTGKNGEYAYMFLASETSVNQASKTYYFHAETDGSYTIQSCSGEAYSYLDVARYDRHLVVHSARPRHRFHLRSSGDESPWPENEYILQNVQNAALFETLATKAHSLSELQVLTPVEGDKITPALAIRRTLGDARGVMALYPCGENPGQVPPLMSTTLRACIDEAQAMAEDKNTTMEQAEEMCERLEQAARTYEETAAASLIPVTEGYYWLTNAYRAFELRQGKQKLMREQEVDGQLVLRWNDAAINDGTTVFHLSPSGEHIAMQDYMGRWVGSPTPDHAVPITADYAGTAQTFVYDTEGMFTIADTSLPTEFFSAANSSVGERGLYGKPNDGDIVASGQGYLYPGYCASWTLQRAYHEVTILSSGWGVLSVSFPAEVPEGVDVYSVADRDGTLFLVPYTNPVIPALTAVVLHAPKGTYTFWSTSEQVAPISENVLVACCEDIKNMESGSMALLKVKNGEVGFQKSTSKQIAAGSAYIPYREGQDSFRVLQQMDDGIESVQELKGSRAQDLDGQCYDLSGRKLPSHSNSPIIIVNNKKILNR